MLARPVYYPIKLQHTWVELERTDRRGKGTKNIGNTCSSNTCPVDHLEMFEAENPSDCFGCMFGVGVQLCGTKIKRLWTKWATSPTFFIQHVSEHIQISLKLNVSTLTLWLLVDFKSSLLAWRKTTENVSSWKYIWATLYTGCWCVSAKYNMTKPVITALAGEHTNNYLV